MAEPTIEQVVDIASELLAAKRITVRQYHCWLATRVQGMTFRDAAAYLRREHLYDVSHFTVMMDSREVHELMVRVTDAIDWGVARFGHTIAAGAESWFAPDGTLADVARRNPRGITKKKAAELFLASS